MEAYLKDHFPELAKDKALLDELVDACMIKKTEADEVIIDYGSFVRFIPLVVSGLIKVIRESPDGREILLYFLSGGDTCAATFSCCMIRKRSEVKAIAEESSLFLAIPLEAADRWMGTYAVWRNFVMNMYDQRLFAMIDTIDKLAFANLDEKLWDYLRERVNITGKDEQEVSHQKIAYDLNVSREAISRLLKKLERQEKIKIYRNKLKVMS